MIDGAAAACINLAYGNDRLADVVLTNNVATRCGAYVVTTGTYTIDGLVSDGNVWDSRGTARLQYAGRNMSLAQWSVITGQDVHSCDVQPFGDAAVPKRPPRERSRRCSHVRWC